MNQNRKNGRGSSIGDLLSSLKERAKELNCLYAVEEAMKAPDATPAGVCGAILRAIPPGWQYPGICQVQITVDGETYRTPDFVEAPWKQTAPIRVQDRVIGDIEVSYRRRMPEEDDGPFLAEEARLVRTIADRFGHFIHFHAIRQHYHEWEAAKENLEDRQRGDWRIIVDLLAHTDEKLYRKLGHKMLNHLCWSGIEEAEALLQRADIHRRTGDDALERDSNVPHKKARTRLPLDLSEPTFRIAAEHLTDEDILFRIQKWMQEDKMGFLVRAVERNLPLSEVADAIRRYHHITRREAEISSSLRAGVRVSLIRRFLSDQLGYIKVAKEYMGIADFHDLLAHMVYTPESYGRLGGKSAGLYLAAKILEKEAESHPELAGIVVPRTWHVTSDMQLDFMHHNNLDEIVEQKYKDLAQIRAEYPHIVHLCKNSLFPPDLVNGLAVALDDFGDVPLIVRSSSVLEDRVGSAFSGKYKSLFVGNRGTKQERLEALLDAVAEVYASMFGPDPIEYRTERGLLDFAEEMGIMIQEVVGTRVGRYWVPLFAGVAFSRNEFRWSPRIRREDGLIRLVPGLGTRAVDRLGDDYPIMFAPGQPGLRVNVSPEDVLRYSPQYVDAIDLERNTLVTITIDELHAAAGDDLPLVPKVLSAYRNGEIRPISPVQGMKDDDRIVCSFDGLMANGGFIRQMDTMLKVLESKLGTPVDIEFAHDGRSLHLLQCRAQCYDETAAPAPIPKDLPRERVVFTARKFVSNGTIPDVTHVVYVDPERYSELPDVASLRDVGRAVSRLNKVLPKRQFILMGPGRWGSRGDIKLGVNVTYSDISNTAMLVEVARQKGNYTPDLSFGTHFFQDLVEARIRYLPLYPDDPDVQFNERFLKGSHNVLADLAPDFAHLSDTVRVIDVARSTEGLTLSVLMNADLDEAVAFLGDPVRERAVRSRPEEVLIQYSDTHWRWRLRVAEQLARRLEGAKYGVAGLYVFGSTKNATARAESDIDLLVHFRGRPDQRELLEHWLEGWSLSLDELNHVRTGHRIGGLLDVHFVSDEDIRKGTSYAVKIGAVTDPARPLQMRSAAPGPEELLG